METPGVSGEVFNIACNTRQTLLDIAEQIGKFLGRTLERKHVASRAGDVKHTLADISKAQSKLGYEPTIDFAEGMRRTCDYFVRRFGAAAA
jgi:nucleoside-diphosphate-sugar epimerase